MFVFKLDSSRQVQRYSKTITTPRKEKDHRAKREREHVNSFHNIPQKLLEQAYLGQLNTHLNLGNFHPAEQCILRLLCNFIMIVCNTINANKCYHRRFSRYCQQSGTAMVSTKSLLSKLLTLSSTTVRFFQFQIFS